MRTYKWWDGKIVPGSQFVMSDNDHSLHYGTGVFEGESAYPELDETGQPTGRWHIVLAQEHGQRLVEGAAKKRIPLHWSEPEVTQGAATIVGLNRQPDSIRIYVRRLLTRGEGLGVDPAESVPTMSVRTAPWNKPYYKEETLFNGGASCFLTRRKRFHPSQADGSVKQTGSYFLGADMKLDAKEVGASDGLATQLTGADLNGHPDPDQMNILDVSGGNIYVITANHEIIYPDAERMNVLGGRTFHLLRRHCFPDLKLTHATGQITLGGFRRGDYIGAFISGTAVETFPWTMLMYLDEHDTLQKLPINHGQVHEIFVKVRDWYTQFRHGQLEKYRGPEFLTPVPCDQEIETVRRQLERPPAPQPA